MSIKSELYKAWFDNANNTRDFSAEERDVYRFGAVQLYRHDSMDDVIDLLRDRMDWPHLHWEKELALAGMLHDIDTKQSHES